MRLLLADQGQEWTEDVVTKDIWQKGDLKKSCVSTAALAIRSGAGGAQ